MERFSEYFPAEFKIEQEGISVEHSPCFIVNMFERVQDWGGGLHSEVQELSTFEHVSEGDKGWGHRRV